MNLPEKPNNKDKNVKIDFDGLQQRIIALPIPAKSYIQLETAKEGVILYTEQIPQQSSLTLHRFTLEKRKSEKVVDNISYFEISSDGSKYLYVTTSRQYVVSDPTAEPKLKEESLKINEIKIKVDPLLEW
ncbi:unnamed protein product, partial [marine sediment metagenome]